MYLYLRMSKVCRKKFELKKQREINDRCPLLCCVVGVVCGATNTHLVQTFSGSFQEIVENQLTGADFEGGMKQLETELDVTRRIVNDMRILLENRLRLDSFVKLEKQVCVCVV